MHPFTISHYANISDQHYEIKIAFLIKFKQIKFWERLLPFHSELSFRTLSKNIQIIGVKLSFSH
jgi:hypothetical protein